MTAAPRTKRLPLAVWPVALALLVAMTCAGNSIAQAAEEGDEDYDHILNTDKRIFDSILGVFGLGGRSGGTIEYRERSPLVVPPARSLPPPEPNAARTNPAWPVDPELQEAREEAAARKSGRQVSVDPALPVGPKGLSTSGANTLSRGRDVDPALPVLKEKGFLSRLYDGELWGTKEEVGKFEGEPPRTTLTAPPPGYQTPSPAAPYGVTKRPFEVEKKEKKI